MVVTYFSGLDLGQQRDYTALAVAERTSLPDPERPDRTVFHFALRHFQRWPLGTPYPTIVADVRTMFAAPPLERSILAIDQTGVGRAVVDLFRSAGIAASLRPLTITGGESSSRRYGGEEKLGGCNSGPAPGRPTTRSPRRCPWRPVLAEELGLFRVKITLAANETFEAWRERDHDDLVLAVAMALYVGSIPLLAWAVG